MRLTHSKWSFALVMAMLFHTISNGQEITKVTSDLETWSSIGLKYKVSNKFSLGFNQDFRLNTNSTKMDKTFSEFGLKYKFNKQFSFGFGTRFILNYKDSELDDKDLRYNFDLGFKHKFSRFQMKYRLRYQLKHEIFGADEFEGKSYLRLKAGLDYNINNWKLDPYMSGEIYRDLTSNSGSFDNLRFTIGTNYRFKKAGEIGLYYRLERELGESYPKTTYIVGFNYVYTIKRKDKKND